MEKKDATLDRAKVVDERFKDRIENNLFPSPKSSTTPKEAGLSKEDCLEIFQDQLTIRHIDFAARYLKESNQSFYTIASSGHEGNAAIARAFRISDMAFLHYRSGAFMLARSRQRNQNNGIREQMLSLVASSEDPISGGRHKVFGSFELNVPPQTSTIASHLPKALGTAFSIQLAKELNTEFNTGLNKELKNGLKIESRLPNDSVILCSFGDASTNHSTSQGTFNAAEWIVHHQMPLPLVFICEDNGIGISVPTPSDWIELSIKPRPGIEYIACDGLNFCDVYAAAKKAEYVARIKRKPVFLHFKTVRLLGHAGSDIEFHYHSLEEINKIEENDPLLHSAEIMIQNGFMTSKEILEKYEEIRKTVRGIADEVIKLPKLSTAEEIMTSIIPPKLNVSLPPLPKMALSEPSNLSARRAETEIEKSEEKQLRQMAQLLNRGLSDILAQFPNVVLFGEDVGKKGGVYRITANLQKQFGRRRVFDTLLDEQTILGTAIGLAHNGFIPIPEIQFLAYTVNAFDQIRGEAATLSFFSKGQFTNPMVIRIQGLGYQKGFGGHFHNDNAFAFLREIPGLIIACPSNGVDAVKLLRKCVAMAYQEQRVIVFLEPIALYMTKDLHQSGDNLWQGYYPEINKENEDNKNMIEFGKMGIYGEGKDLIIISYANGYYLSRQAEKICKEKYNINIKIIDLRWLAPLNHKGILEEVKNYKNILIVDEGRKTGSISEEIVTNLIESLPRDTINIRRITGKDCFIPLGKAWEQVLPSLEEIVSTIKDMVKNK